MKLYMQQDTFRWGSPMPLCDKSGKPRYTLTTEAYSLGKRLHVTDLAGREAIYIRQLVPSLFPRYEIEVYGKPVVTLCKDLTFLRPRYTMEPLDWEITGILGARDYEISRQSALVASSSPQQEDSDKSVVALSLYDRNTALTALGILLTINCVFAPQEPKHL